MGNLSQLGDGDREETSSVVIHGDLIDLVV